MLALLGFLLLCVGSVALPCHVQGCQPSRQYVFDELGGSKATIKAEIKWKVAGYRPTGLGCVSTSEKVACPLISHKEGPRSPGLIVLDIHGKSLWMSYDLYSPALPFFYEFEGLVASDGFSIVGYFSNGTSRGKSIKIVYPSPVFSMTLTEQDDIFLAFQAGLLYTFDLEAIPTASIELKATVGEVNGTFLPYISPAVGGSIFYILAHFKPDTLQAPSLPQKEHRLYAINMTHLMSPRMNITWYYEFESDADVMDNPLLLQANNWLFFRGADSHPLHSTLYAVSDEGYSVKKQWEVSFNYAIQTLAYFATPSSDSSGALYMSLNEAGNTAFLVINPQNGAVTKTLRLSDAFDVSPLLVTSEIMMAPDEKTPSESPQIFFGFQTSDTFGVASVSIAASEPRLNWNIPSPDGNAVVGQLANFDSDVGRPSQQIVCTTKSSIFSLLLTAKK